MQEEWQRKTPSERHLKKETNNTVVNHQRQVLFLKTLWEKQCINAKISCWTLSSTAFSAPAQKDDRACPKFTHTYKVNVLRQNSFFLSGGNLLYVSAFECPRGTSPDVCYYKPNKFTWYSSGNFSKRMENYSDRRNTSM